LTFPTINQWLAVALLGLAAWCIIIPREPELIMPVARQPLRLRMRDLLDRLRGNAGLWAEDPSDPDGEKFVRRLQPEQEQPRTGPASILGAVPAGFYAAPPRTSLVTDQQPPWEISPEPAPAPAPQTGPHAWSPGSHRNPPTLVNDMRALMEEDPDGVKRYVERLPHYKD
jgi:hypothetical protein